MTSLDSLLLAASMRSSSSSGTPMARSTRSFLSAATSCSASLFSSSAISSAVISCRSVIPLAKILIFFEKQKSPQGLRRTFLHGTIILAHSPSHNAEEDQRPTSTPTGIPRAGISRYEVSARCPSQNRACSYHSFLPT